MVVEIGGEGAVLPGEFEDRPPVLHKLRNEPTLSRIAKYSPRQRHVAADDLFERVGGHFVGTHSEQWQKYHSTKWQKCHCSNSCFVAKMTK